MSTAELMQPPIPTAPEPRENYLTAAYGVKSWLLTTDHKRIAHLVSDVDHADVFPGRRGGHVDSIGIALSRRIFGED